MKKSVAISLLIALSSTPLFGEWLTIPLQELVAESDLIIIGTLRSATEDNDGIGRGRIKVENIIAGKAVTTGGSPLGVGDDLRIRWADNWACAEGMHQGRIGEKGIWLLDVQDDGSVSAAYPGKFTTLDDLPEIRRLIRKKNVKGSVKVDVASERLQEAESNFVSLANDEMLPDEASLDVDRSLLRAGLVLLIAMGIFPVLYRSRFRIR